MDFIDVGTSLTNFVFLDGVVFSNLVSVKGQSTQ